MLRRGGDEAGPQLQDHMLGTSIDDKSSQPGIYAIRLA
jgi:hypothetical protein